MSRSHPVASRLARALALAFPLAVGAPLLANADETVTETVLVTATRFGSAELAGNPIGARVISAEEIADSGANNVAEALNRLGGVHIRQDLFGGSNPGLDLRGFGSTGDQNTLVLVDGVRLSENELQSARLSGVSLERIERIEIMPSGGAVLYGGNATGGVINIITRQGRFNGSEGTVWAGLGNFGTHDLRATASAGGERLSFSADAQDRRSGGERKNNRSKASNANARLALKLDQSDFTLSLGSERQDAGLPGPRTNLQWRSDRRGSSTPLDDASTDLWFVNLAATHRIGDFEFAANLARRDRSTDFFNDYGFATYSRDHRRVRADEFTPRVKWAGKLAGRANELIVGYDWRDWDFSSRRYDDFGFGFAGASQESGKQRTHAIYFQNTLQLAAGSELSLGARGESARSERDVPFALTMTSGEEKKRRHLSAWSAAFKQELGNGFSAHLRSGTSYRLANIDENRCYDPTGCRLLKPQTSRDHEIGLAWKKAGASLSAVLFTSRLEDEIYYNNFLFTNVNMPPTRRQGLELSGDWTPYSALSLHASYSFIRATFRKGVFAGVDVSGKRIPLVPRHRASLSATWLISDRDRLYLGVNYTGSQQYDNDPANRYSKMPTYTTVDGKYSHRIGDATLALAVNNMFNKKYYSYALVNSSLAPTIWNAYPDRSRSVMASFEYRFR